MFMQSQSPLPPSLSYVSLRFSTFGLQCKQTAIVTPPSSADRRSLGCDGGSIREGTGEETGIFFAFNAGNPCVERVKAQNVRGGCSLGGPHYVATAVVKGQCRRSSYADVQFYGFEFNSLFNLSIIYQYFSSQSFRDGSAHNWIVEDSHKNS